jgi:uncharacterized repeat protein (TIGR01451 family)
MTASFRILLSLLLALALAQGAAAQQPSVSSSLVAQRVVAAGGTFKLEPADSARPGDVIQYSVTYTNHGANAVQGLVASLPIPAGTSYIAGSALPAATEASTDGRHFAALPLQRSVRQPDGSLRTEAVPATEYRALRWNLGALAAGQSAEVRARVQVAANAAASAAAAK